MWLNLQVIENEGISKHCCIFSQNAFNSFQNMLQEKNVSALFLGGGSGIRRKYEILWIAFTFVKQQFLSLVFMQTIPLPYTRK